MDLAAVAAKAKTGGKGGAAARIGGTFLTALTGQDAVEELRVAADPMLQDAQTADVDVSTVATIKLQSRVARKRVKNVKRDPKTGMEIKNEWQRDTDIMYYLSSTNVSKIKDEFELKAAEQQGEGLTLVEFVFVMIKCLGAFVVNQVDFVVQAVDLFRQVDVNDDGSMTWDEFTSYIVEAGLAQGQGVENSVAVQYRYKFIAAPDHNVHTNPISSVFRLPAPLNCVAAVERGSEMLKMYRPSSDPARAQLKQTKLLRHDTAYSPHEVLTCLAIPEALTLVTSSQQSLTGPFHISFWDADTLTLKRRVTTQTPHSVMCWSQRAQTLFSAGHGVGAGTSSPIIAWNIKSFKKMRSLVWHTSHVTDMTVIPGNVMNHLVSASHDGSMVLWDMRSYTCLQQRVIVAHEFGVAAITYSQRLSVLASYGAGGNPSAGKAMSCYAVHLWDTVAWVGRGHRRRERRAGGRGRGGDPSADGSSDESSSSDEEYLDEEEAKRRAVPRPVLLKGHVFPLVGVAFQDEESAPGPPHIVSADLKGNVRVWHAITHECLQTLNVVRVPSVMQRAARATSRKDAKNALLLQSDAMGKTTRRRAKLKSRAARRAEAEAETEAETKTEAQSKLASAARGGGDSKTAGNEGEALGSASQEEGKADASGSGRKSSAVNIKALVEEARRTFSPVVRQRSVAEEYEVVSDSDDEQEAAAAAKAKLASRLAASHANARKDKYLHRLDCLLALPPSGTAANTATVILCGDGFRMMRLQQIVARPQPLVGLEFNPTSFTFVTATASRITVWDAISGRVLRAYPASTVCSDGGSITSLCLDGRQRKLIVGDSNGSIRVLNFTNGAVMKELDPHHGVVSSLVYSKEDGCVISTSWDSTVHVCDERPQHGFSRQPTFRSVLLRRAKIPPLEGISALADSAGLEAGSFGSFESDPDSDDDLMHTASSAFTAGTGGGTLHGTGEGVTRHGFASVDVTIAALSPHLNLFACAARGMNNSHMVLLWRYDKTILVGACVPTGKYQHTMGEVTALHFLEPHPYLFCATSNGNMFLFAVPPHPHAGVAVAAWSAPPKYHKTVVSVAMVDTAKHPMLHLRTGERKRRFSVLGTGAHVGRGYILFTGDDTGVIHRWELPEGFIKRLGGGGPAARVTRSATVERRMGKSLIAQHTLASVVASVRYSSRLSKVKPLEGAFYGRDDAVAARVGDYLPVWCGCWQAHEDAVSQIQWMEHSATVLSGSADGYARVWNGEGVLLGTLDPNPRNQPAPTLSPEILTQQLAAKLQKEAEQRRMFSENANGISGGRHPSISASLGGSPAGKRSATDSGKATGKAGATPAVSMMEVETQVLLHKAAAAVRAQLEADKLKMPDVPPSVMALEYYHEAQTVYQFAYMLGSAPAVKPVKWHLEFDLERRRRKDEQEAHVILPDAKLMRTAKIWKRKTLSRHRERRKKLEEAKGVLRQHGLEELMMGDGDGSTAAAGAQDSGRRTPQPRGSRRSSAGEDAEGSDSDSVASMLMADDELIAAQERQKALEEPGVTADGRDALVDMLSDLTADGQDSRPSSRPGTKRSRRRSSDPIFALLRTRRREKRRMRRRRTGATTGSRLTTSASSTRRTTATAGAVSAAAPPPLRATASAPAPATPPVGAPGPQTPLAQDDGAAQTMSMLRRESRDGAASVAPSVDSLMDEATNEYLVNYSALGTRSRMHKDYGSKGTTPDNAVLPSYYTQYSNLRAYKSLLPPTALPSSPHSAMGTRKHTRKKPTIKEIMNSGPMAALEAAVRQRRQAGRAPDIEDYPSGHQRQQHRGRLRSVTASGPSTRRHTASMAMRGGHSASMPALRASRSLPRHASRVGDGFADGTASLWDHDGDAGGEDDLQLGHAAGPGTRPGGRQPQALRPGLTMFDRNPRSAVDSGGTRYPPILSAKLRPGPASRAFREMERRWRKSSTGFSNITRDQMAATAPSFRPQPVRPSSRLGKSLR